MWRMMRSRGNPTMSRRPYTGMATRRCTAASAACCVVARHATTFRMAVKDARQSRCSKVFTSQTVPVRSCAFRSEGLEIPNLVVNSGHDIVVVPDSRFSVDRTVALARTGPFTVWYLGSDYGRYLELCATAGQ